MTGSEDLQALRARLAEVSDAPALLAGLVAAAPFAVQVFRADGHPLVANAAFRELFGAVPPPEYNALKDEQAQALGVLPAIQRAFGGEVVHIPTVWYDPRENKAAPVREGRRVAVSATGFPLFGADGRVEHVVVVFRDETAAQRAREQEDEDRNYLRGVIRRHEEVAGELEAQERQFTALFECALDGISIADDQGRFLAVNPAGCAIFGLPREELLGRRLLDFSPGARAFRSRWREFLAEGNQRGEVRIHRADGTIRDLEYQATARFQPGRHLSIFRDITDRKEADRRLRSSEANLAAAQRIVSLGSWEMDIQGGVPAGGTLRWSDEVFRIFGYEPGTLEVTRESFFRHVPEAEHERIHEAVRRAIEDGTQYAIEHRIVRPDGEERVVREQSDVFYDARTGEPVRMVGTIQDITEQRRVEDALRQTESNIRQIMDLIPYGIFCKDAEGRLLFCNQRFAETSGVPREHLIGRHQYEWSPDREQADRFLQDDLEVIRSGVPKVIPEEYFTDPSGVTHVLRTTKVPFRPAGSTTPAVLCISIEITELRRTQDELERSHALLRAVVESSSSPIYSVDREYRYTTFNSAHATEMRRLFGVDVHLGDSILELLGTPARIGPLRIHLDRALAGEAFTTEARLGEDPGALAWLQHSFNPLRTPGGGVAGVTVVVQDVTAQHRTAEAIADLNAILEQRVAERTAQLEAANRELEAFAYTVSHDLRAPLRSIDGFARLLLDDHADCLREAGAAQVARIRAATQRMGRLIDDLLAFSRLGRQAVRRNSVDVRRLVRQVAEEISAAEAPRRLEFVLGDLPTCRADPTLLRQVFANLLGNAAKFTRGRDPARIEIDSRFEGDGRVWVVRDNGVGFDPAYAEKMFGVFQRLHRQEDYEGTGVGLAIVQRIVELHGGEIRAEGTPGSGASFAFTLPDDA